MSALECNGYKVWLMSRKTVVLGLAIIHRIISYLFSFPFYSNQSPVVKITPPPWLKQMIYLPVESTRWIEPRPWGCVLPMCLDDSLYHRDMDYFGSNKEFCDGQLIGARGFDLAELIHRHCHVASRWFGLALQRVVCMPGIPVISQLGRKRNDTPIVFGPGQFCSPNFKLFNGYGKKILRFSKTILRSVTKKVVPTHVFLDNIL